MGSTWSSLNFPRSCLTRRGIALQGFGAHRGEPESGQAGLESLCATEADLVMHDDSDQQCFTARSKESPAYTTSGEFGSIPCRRG